MHNAPKNGREELTIYSRIDPLGLIAPSLTFSRRAVVESAIRIPNMNLKVPLNIGFSKNFSKLLSMTSFTPFQRRFSQFFFSDLAFWPFQTEVKDFKINTFSEFATFLLTFWTFSRDSKQNHRKEHQKAPKWSQNKTGTFQFVVHHHCHFHEIKREFSR